MSNSEQNDLIEIEKKYLISDITAKKIIDDGNLKCVKNIFQIYLFQENSNVQYNLDENHWEITLKHNFESEKFIVPEVKHPNEAQEIFKDFRDTNLLYKKCAARIRITDGFALFTYKEPNPDGAGDFEFEFSINDLVQGSELFQNFIENDFHKIKKERFVVEKDGLDFEIDFFKDVDLSKVKKDLDIESLGSENLCLLEIEFKNEKDFDAHKLNYPSIDVTNKKAFKNVVMSYNLAEDRKKLDKKTNKFKKKFNL